MYNQYFKFWHRFDTDSLLDGCWIECSDDSGANWYPLNTPGIGTLALDNNFNACNLYTNQLSQSNFDTLADGRYAWSGNSQGWRYTAMELNMVMPLKTWRNSTINALRFVFQSDSIQTNKSGWVIDDIEIGYVINCGGLNAAATLNALPIYPNPSSNGLFQVSFPNHYIETTIAIYNLQGQLVMNIPLTKTLNLSRCAAGLYYYKTTIDTHLYSGTLSIIR